MLTLNRCNISITDLQPFITNLIYDLETLCFDMFCGLFKKLIVP